MFLRVSQSSSSTAFSPVLFSPLSSGLLEMMNTAYVCVTVFVVLWEPMMSAPENCLKMEVDGNVSRNKLITVEDNAYTNVSFQVKLDDCHNSPQHWFLKMSRKENNMVLDECKLVFINKSCQEKEGEQPCSCPENDRQTINFRKFFSKSEYSIYHWTASPYFTVNSETLMEIVFAIRKPAAVKDVTNSYNDTSSRGADDTVLCLSLPFIAVPCAAVVIIVVVVAVACCIRRRCKARGRRQVQTQTQGNETQTEELLETPIKSKAKRWKR